MTARYSEPADFTPTVYSRWRQSPLGKITEALERDAITAMLPESRGAVLLDAGCGDGTSSVREAGRGAIVTGLDRSHAMLDAARERANASGVVARWCQGDVESLPFADASFDVALAITVFCMVKSPEQAVRELARVLRPGGVLVIGELGRWSSWAASRRIRAWFGDQFWQNTHFWTFGELRDLATAAGLTCTATRSAIFYPPCVLAARIASRWDTELSRLGGWGAAFLVVKATKHVVNAGDANPPAARLR
jgi:SAM-dependent methyltransferase